MSYAEPNLVVGKCINDYVFEAVAFDNGKIVLTQWTNDKEELEATRILHNHSTSVRAAAFGYMNDNLIFASADYQGKIFIYFFSSSDLDSHIDVPDENPETQTEDKEEKKTRKNWLKFMMRIPAKEQDSTNKYCWRVNDVTCMSFSEAHENQKIVLAYFTLGTCGFIEIKAVKEKKTNTQVEEKPAETETKSSFFDTVLKQAQKVRDYFGNTIPFPTGIGNIEANIEEANPLPSPDTYEFTVSDKTTRPIEIWNLKKKEENGRSVLELGKLQGIKFLNSPTPLDRAVFGKSNKLICVQPQVAVGKSSWVAIQETDSGVDVVIAIGNETAVIWYKFKPSGNDSYVCDGEVEWYEHEVQQKSIGQYWNNNNVCVCRNTMRMTNLARTQDMHTITESVKLNWKEFH